MALMSLFDRETIPASLLHDQCRDDGDASNGSDGEADFEDDSTSFLYQQCPPRPSESSAIPSTFYLTLAVA
jgi:hypothetical protein